MALTRNVTPLDSEIIYQLGLITQKIFSENKIIGLNDIISWKEGLEVRRSNQTPGLEYKKRVEQYQDVNLKIQYLRSYLNQITYELNTGHQLIAQRIALTRFGYGLCAEQTFLAKLIFQEECFKANIQLDCKIFTIYRTTDTSNHAFLVFGNNLSILSNQFNSLNQLLDNAYVYDPTFKIFVKANEYCAHPYIKELCREYGFTLMEARTSDNAFSPHSKEEIALLKEECDKTFLHAYAGIQKSSQSTDGDHKILKILNDFVTHEESRKQISTTIKFSESQQLWSAAANTDIQKTNENSSQHKQTNYSIGKP